MVMIEIRQKGTLEFRPGKIYKVFHEEGLHAIQEDLLYARAVDKQLGTVLLDKDKYFIFIESVWKGNSEFSKILVDDKVLVTYNPYSLKTFAAPAYSNSLDNAL